MDSFLLAQLMGVIGLLIALSIFQFNNREQMLKMGVLGSVFLLAQFVLLGAFTGAAMCIIGGLRSYVFFKVKPTKNHTWILIVFMSLSVVASVVTWQGPISLLALAGNLFGGFAIWHRTPKYIRRWALAAPPMWFVYNAVNGAIPGMILEVVMLTSNLIGEYRYDFRHKSHIKRRLARVA